MRRVDRIAFEREPQNNRDQRYAIQRGAELIKLLHEIIYTE